MAQTRRMGKATRKGAATKSAEVLALPEIGAPAALLTSHLSLVPGVPGAIGAIGATSVTDATGVPGCESLLFQIALPK